MPFYAYPRPNRRGLIEALLSAIAPGRHSAATRGPTAAASLKRARHTDAEPL